MKKIITLLTLSINIIAFNKTYIYESYEYAKSDQRNYIRLSSESTKLGFITTEYDGYVKHYDISYSIEKNILSNLKITINSSSIDTDNSARNDKMYSETLEIKKFPLISFEGDSSIRLKDGKAKLTGLLKIRNTTRKSTLHLNITKIDNKIVVKGQTEISLKDYQIPDPSIVIAKVRDKHLLEFGHAQDE